MSKYTYRLTALSPWFLNGAEPRGQPELRASSIRGGLRYWLRAMIGAHATHLETWQAESAVFGSTGQSSAVTVRVYGKSPEATRVPMLPHRTEKRSFTDAIMPMYAATLELVTRPGISLPSDALDALKVWSLLGGLGKRSRRMFGAVDVRPNAEGMDWYSLLNSPEALKQAITTTLEPIITSSANSSMPPFPTLHPQHSWVIVGRRVYEDAVDANIDLFRELLRKGRYLKEEDTFGYAK